jgi:prepilin-type processing-associated H-X9-DG protein
VNAEAHRKSANYLFVDGHVENLLWTDVQSRLSQPNSTFLVP